jgi:tRNA (cytidine/uridine-2'-O-)-methyltransferase
MRNAAMTPTLQDSGTPPRLHIVLVEPEIPPNTGNFARLCAATRSTLHLIEPLGFKLDDSQLKRAGMDYWKHVAWHKWANWPAFEASLPAGAKLWFIEQAGTKRYSDATFGPEDYLVFGRETAGLPKRLLERFPDRWLHIPMFNSEARSLNLSNCVALVLYEALRQQGFPGELK